MLLCNEPQDFNTLFAEETKFSVLSFIILFLVHVAFKKVMLKLKEQLQIAWHLFLQ